MRRSLAFAFVLGVAFAVGSQAVGQEKAAPPAKKMAPAKKTAAARKPAHVIMNPSDMKWVDAPPILPPGAKMAVLQGDPNKPGLFTIRLKVGDGYKVAAHWHPMTEHITVISGTFHLGTGDKFDESKAAAMAAGAYATMPAKMRHYAWSTGETEVQVYGMGPFKLVYVNPQDDPSKKAEK